jgi:hypothetical protein
MRRVLTAVGLGLVLFLAVAAAGVLFGDGDAGVVMSISPVSVPVRGPVKMVRYACADGRSFSLQVFADGQAVFGDRTNGRGFNIRDAYLTPMRIFGDGTLVVGAYASAGFVLVDGNVYMTECELRTHHYGCEDGKSFGIDVQGAGEEQIVFTDGTNRKFFTVYKREVSDGRFYSDGVIDLRLGWTDATVAVEGQRYMTGCRLEW